MNPVFIPFGRGQSPFLSCLLGEVQKASWTLIRWVEDVQKGSLVKSVRKEQDKEARHELTARTGLFRE